MFPEAAQVFMFSYWTQTSPLGKTNLWSHEIKKKIKSTTYLCLITTRNRIFAKPQKWPNVPLLSLTWMITCYLSLILVRRVEIFRLGIILDSQLHSIHGKAPLPTPPKKNPSQSHLTKTQTFHKTLLTSSNWNTPWFPMVHVHLSWSTTSIFLVALSCNYWYPRFDKLL